MFTRKTTGILAASLTAGALLTMPAASAAPTWTHIQNIGLSGNLQTASASAVADNGDAIVAWIRDDRVMAASAEHGAFGPAYYVSEVGDVATKPNVAINDQGDAVVVWVQEDNLGHARLTANRRNADGSFDAGYNYLSKAAEQDVEGAVAAPVAIQANGTVRAAYASTDGAQIHQVRVSSWAKGALTASTTTVSDNSAGYPDIAVNDAGAVQVVWHDFQGSSEQVKTRRLPAGVNVWGLTQNASVAGTLGLHTRVAMSASGAATVAFVRQDGSFYRVQATKIAADGTPGSPTYVSPADADANEIDLDQNDDGTALLAWIQTKDVETRVGHASRTLGGTWSAGLLAKAIDQPSAPVAGISDNGVRFVGYTGDERMLAAYQTSSIQPWSLFNSGDLNVYAPSTLGGIDDQGNAFLGSVAREADPTKSHVIGRFLDTAGPKTWLTKPSTYTVGTGPTVSWSAGDRLSDLGDADVKVRAAAWNGGFNAVSYAAQHDADGKLTYAGKGGRTYCFSARTRDAVGNTGAFSAERCTTTALDDKLLTNVSGFHRVTSANGYNGGYSVSTTQGASLRLTGVHASRLALLVSKVGSGGTVAVYFHGDKLGSCSLAGTGNKVVVPVATLGSVETGTVVVKVTSADGKTVRIDGLFAAQ